MPIIVALGCLAGAGRPHKTSVTMILTPSHLQLRLIWAYVLHFPCLKMFEKSLFFGFRDGSKPMKYHIF
jgi:hypothetical protein